MSIEHRVHRLEESLRRLRIRERRLRVAGGLGALFVFLFACHSNRAAGALDVRPNVRRLVVEELLLVENGIRRASLTSEEEGARLTFFREDGTTQALQLGLLGGLFSRGATGLAIHDESGAIHTTVEVAGSDAGPLGRIAISDYAVLMAAESAPASLLLRDTWPEYMGGPGTGYASGRAGSYEFDGRKNVVVEERGFDDE